MKAQSSIEFITMIAIGLTISAPFIIAVQENIIGLQQDTRSAEFSASIDEMVNAIEKSEALGARAEAEFTLNIPDRVEEAYIREGFLIFTRSGAEGASNLTRSPEVNTTILGNIPVEQGDYTGKAFNNGSHIILQYPRWNPDSS